MLLYVFQNKFPTIEEFQLYVKKQGWKLFLKTT